MASGIWHLACQTYALNFIDSHSGQKQAPQLFLSSKSFRVAKSTPSLATSSAKLSPISKWLSKPPLLSKSALVLALLLLLSYTQNVQALTAYTSRVIEGSAPYLTLDGGITKVTDTNNLLYIELPDGRTITPSTNTSTATNPIRLPSGNFTFNDIHMILPSGTTTTSLNSLISQGKWGDDDGDGQGAGGVAASGSISLAIKDKDGTTVSRGDALSICKAPYKVTLSSAGGNLVTQYGVPNNSTFSGGTSDYYITLPSQPVICSVRPNLFLGGIGILPNDTPRFAGPANMWSPTKGFLTQSTSSSSYGLNFPTTGSNGLYFDLDVGGIDAGQLIWTVNTSGSLGATVRWTRPLTGAFTDPTGSPWNADEWITDKSKNVTRVTLSGPKADSAQKNSSSPSPLIRPILPQTFELVGRDSSGNEVRYGFVLRQWFVNRGGKIGDYSDQLAWCNSLGYSMPRVRDLTNAKCGVDNTQFPCVNGIDGVAPNSSENHYMRHIGAGFFTEWGLMYDYADAGFTYYIYWTSDANIDGRQFNVFSQNGDVGSNFGSYGAYAVCSAR